MSKIYLVSGIYENTYKFVDKAFRNLNDAEKYKDALVDDEIQAADMANKCRNCDGNNKECPFYIEPSYGEIGCDCYMPEHDEVVYIIDEVDFEE